MSLPQRKFREVLFQWLYSYGFGDEKKVLLMREAKVSRESMDAIESRGLKILEYIEDIDSKITLAAKDYDFERIQFVERAILRLAIYEICYDEDIPPKVAISEAIRLSRKFSTPESSSFVNAVLDNIKNRE